MRDNARHDITPLFNSVAFSVLQRIALRNHAPGVQPERLNVTLESDIGRMDFILQNLRHLRTARGIHLSLPFPRENREPILGTKRPRRSLIAFQKTGCLLQVLRSVFRSYY